jgi:hypothetical protein
LRALSVPLPIFPTCPDPSVNLLFDPVDPWTIYVANNPNGIHKSVNGGLDWSAMNEGLSDRRVSALAMDPNSSNTLYLGTPDGTLYTSFDGSTSWIHPEPKFGPITGFAADALGRIPGQTTLYVATDGGGVFEKHGDQPCFPINNGLRNLRISAVSFNPQPEPPGDPMLYVATNGGGVFAYDTTVTPPTWIPMNRGLTSLNVSSLATAMTTSGRVAYFAGTHDRGIFRSLDGGRSWVMASRGMSDPQVSALSGDPSLAGGNLYAGTRRGEVYRSTDLGASWVQLNPGFVPYGTVLSLTSDPVDPQALYVGAVSGLFQIAPWVR